VHRQHIPLHFPAQLQYNVGTMLSIILTIIIVGVLLWVVNSVLPMDPKIRQILNAVVVIVLILWILQAFGLLTGVRLRG